MSKEDIDFLNEKFKKSNPEFLIALRHVVKKKIGIEKLSEKLGCSRSSLYKTLCAKGNPEFRTIIRILDSLDMRLNISIKSNTCL